MFNYYFYVRFGGNIWNSIRQNFGGSYGRTARHEVPLCSVKGFDYFDIIHNVVRQATDYDISHTSLMNSYYFER